MCARDVRVSVFGIATASVALIHAEKHGAEVIPEEVVTGCSVWIVKLEKRTCRS
jgi:hypothetical protein